MGKSQQFNDTEFDSEPAYGDKHKYIKLKIKSYDDKVNKHF